MFPYTTTDLRARFENALYPASLRINDEAALWLQRTAQGKRLALLAPSGHAWLGRFSGDAQAFEQGYVLKLCPTDATNAKVLRDSVPNLKPVPLGQATSAGCGDRLGLATPGHVRAFEVVARQPGAQPIAPIFAQQSIREMTRTHRAPAEVMADATWGAFEGGWRARVGADADHLKTTADIDVCAAVGFSFYTIDPGAFVDSEADTATPDAIRTKVAALRWSDLESSIEDLQVRYADRVFRIEDRDIAVKDEALWRAAAKYGNAIAHVTRMFGCSFPQEFRLNWKSRSMRRTHPPLSTSIFSCRLKCAAWGSNG
jgi:hypothetical protein